jgi:regulator of chromosome condensation
VAAGIDNCLAVNANGKVYSWGFSDSYRTGFGREDSVVKPTPLRNKELANCKVTFAGCGGQFSIIAGPVGPRV